jgi:hypothetical protein
MRGVKYTKRDRVESGLKQSWDTFFLIFHLQFNKKKNLIT